MYLMCQHLIFILIYLKLYLMCIQITQIYITNMYIQYAKDINLKRNHLQFLISEIHAKLNTLVLNKILYIFHEESSIILNGNLKSQTSPNIPPSTLTALSQPISKNHKYAQSSISKETKRTKTSEEGKNNLSESIHEKLTSQRGSRNN